MKNTLLKSVCLGLLALWPAWCVAESAPRVVVDNFEQKPDQALWRFDKLAPGSFEVQAGQVREGGAALRITLRPNDPTPKISAGETERDELQEVDALNVAEGDTATYEFSFQIPSDFPICDTRLVIAQWKQDTHRRPVLVENPVLAFRYVSGRLFLTLQTTAERQVLGTLEKEIRGRWVDVVITICHARKAGKAICRLNGEPFVSYEGATAYGEDLGYPERPTFYFKMGLYRDDMVAPITIYFDRYKKTIIPVGPGG